MKYQFNNETPFLSTSASLTPIPSSYLHLLLSSLLYSGIGRRTRQSTLYVITTRQNVVNHWRSSCLQTPVHPPMFLPIERFRPPVCHHCRKSCLWTAVQHPRMFLPIERFRPPDCHLLPRLPPPRVSCPLALPKSPSALSKSPAPCLSWQTSVATFQAPT